MSSAWNCAFICVAFDVSVTRTGSITSNGGMRGEVCSRCCIGRRSLQFEPELWYLDFRYWGTGRKLHDSLFGSRHEYGTDEYVKVQFIFPKGLLIKHYHMQEE